MVAFVCASVVARNVDTILSNGAQLLLPLVFLHAGGFFLGYVLARATGGREAVARTTAIEVGMQASLLSHCSHCSHLASFFALRSYLTKNKALEAGNNAENKSYWNTES